MSCRRYEVGVGGSVSQYVWISKHTHLLQLLQTPHIPTVIVLSSLNVQALHFRKPKGFKHEATRQVQKPPTLEIPPGMPEGHEVVFEGEGDESPDWEPGDVVLRVRSKKEAGGWRRKESSLYWTETIGIDEVCFYFIIVCAPC